LKNGLATVAPEQLKLEEAQGEIKKSEAEK